MLNLHTWVSASTADVCVCVNSCTQRGQQRISDVLFYHFPSYSLESEFLTEPQAYTLQLGWLAGEPWGSAYLFFPVQEL